MSSMGLMVAGFLSRPRGILKKSIGGLTPKPKSSNLERTLLAPKSKATLAIPILEEC